MSDSKGYNALAESGPDDATQAAAAGAPPPPPGAPPPSLVRRLRWPLIIGGPVIVLLLVLFFWLTGGRYIATDDAYLQAAKVDVSTNVPGRVVEVDVHDNQRVVFGQQLFRLDPRPLQTAAEEAQAQLGSARFTITGQQAAVGQRQADLAAAKSTLAYQTKELARQKVLTGAGMGSAAQLDAQQHNVDAAKAQLDAAQKGLDEALASLGGSLTGNPSANPAVQSAQAAVDRAKLNLSYGVVNAAQPGTVTKVDQLQVGDYVAAAQPLFTLVADRVWVEANFKEDQLAHMRVGQAATFKIDAYPGVTFHGHVDSLSPGTGSSFALLPAENATGNWVKVVQRLPVRIAIDDAPRDIGLHAGLSVSVKVDSGRKRTLFGEKTVTTTTTTNTTTPTSTTTRTTSSTTQTSAPAANQGR